MINLVTFSSLYPNGVRPYHGIFVENRLRRLIETGEVRTRVVAPVPWFPFSSSRFGSYGSFARVSYSESRFGLEINHPRYPVIPKIGMTVAPTLMARGARQTFGQLEKEGYEYSAIDAHYFYPDGVAAVMLGKSLKKPVVITARGTDINLIPRYRFARKQILWAAERCAAMITVCQALKDRLIELGVPDQRVSVLRNGVDLEFFRPVDRGAARARLGIHEPTLLSVGGLIERKRHDVAITALTELREVHLLIAGDGPLKTRLLRRAEELGVVDRVRFLGAVGQAKLRDYYNAADALVLASSREGMANVLLESLACGTPVIATRSWGTPEVVRDPAAGLMMDQPDAASLVRAFHQLMSDYPSRESTRKFAEGFDWGPTTRGQLEIFAGL